MAEKDSYDRAAKSWRQASDMIGKFPHHCPRSTNPDLGAFLLPDAHNFGSGLFNANTCHNAPGRTYSNEVCRHRPAKTCMKIDNISEEDADWTLKHLASCLAPPVCQLVPGNSHITSRFQSKGYDSM